MVLLKYDVVSLDMACTLFWEPGCDPRYSVRYIRGLLWKVIDYVSRKGFSVEKPDDPWLVYRDVWDKLWRRGPRREMWHKYILLKFLYKLGAHIDSKLLDEVYELFIRERIRHFVPVYKADLLLGYLSSRGYKLVLTTGTASHDFAHGLIKRYGYNKYIKLVFSTQLVGIPKTDPRFYEELVDLLGVKPHRIVHVGDSIQHDVKPAEKIGLKTIYYGWRTWCRALDPQPCITSLYELYHLL